MDIRSSADLALTSDDLFLLAKGEWYRSYEKLGAHPATSDGVAGYQFAVWAPDVRSVRVIGDFNGWDIEKNYLSCSENGGVWSGFVAGVSAGDLYKYVVETRYGDLLYKADPYAFYAECPPGTASRTTDLSGYAWKDAGYLAKRAKRDMMKSPLNIFEVHLGSWRRHDDGLAGNGDPDSDDHAGSYLTYDELSDELVGYVRRMGYSHIEVLPVMEHPFDGSWGYQVTGYFAPTSRYGEAKQFKHFVDACHQAGIGVILDWVPGGFCRDEHGLVHFNGDKLYEKEEHPNWGTFKFDLDRGEVRSFLISNLLYWVGEYHADGIRMDGVTSMLYLNFGVDDPRQKKFNDKGTEEDFASIRFIQQCNDTIGKYYPDVMMIAEESTAWPLVTYPPQDGGLGFHLKWDMGWMNDTLHYMQTDFPWRPGNHKLLTFSAMYQFNENFVLPLSHDEVVHGKCSLITRQPGDNWRQFAGMRTLALYQMSHAGAKLNFMGNEIAQFIEWRYYEGIQYFLADQYETHAHQQTFVAALNHFYNEHSALWQRAYTPDGFEWIDADNSEQSVISFVRHGDDPADDVVILINFDVNPREQFRVGLPKPGYWVESLNSDDLRYGGSGVTNEGVRFKSEEEPWNLRDQSIELRLPPLAGLILTYAGPLPKKKAPARKGSTKRGSVAKGAAPAKAPAKTPHKKAPAKARGRKAPSKASR
ncbi:1,4-alpha-glucan branching protein GlgB [Olsenella uli]|uniref:1,4-alpha-glucan branching protein GlgB n=1 Tax=Olsenella uli TaxID=133926 RepID=UPI00044AD661|nr:1,4-alpha-glucan branching protein GlgB [Olsenella uli]EUB32011.1 1,4-alpha-glucan branching enzyme [Olsenella uli MSTE5]